MNKEELSREELVAQLEMFEARYERVKKSAKAFLHRNQEKRLLASCKGNAKKKALEFDLELSDIDIPLKCKFLGIELTNIFGEGRVDSNASIDRLDPTKGYVKGNIQIISDKANKMKQNATKEELVCFAKNIIRLYKKGEL